MTHEWFDNELLTDPQEFAIATTERSTYSWNVLALLDEGESAATPSIRIDRMMNRNTGVVVSEEDLVTDVSVIDNVVVATIDGSKLQADKLYRVMVTFVASPSKTISCMTMMKCVA